MQHILVHSLFQSCQRSVSVHLLSDPVDFLLHLKLLEHGAEGVGDDEDHDHEPDHQDQQSWKNVPDVLEMSNSHPVSSDMYFRVSPSK